MSTTDGEKVMNHIKNILTFDEVVEVAKRITNDNSVQVLDCSLNDLSQEKLGFTGTHHILTITVQKSIENRRESLSAFVKITSLPGLDESGKMIAERESFLLNTVVSKFMEDYKSEKWCPIHYYTKKNAIIMEDLRLNGYKMIEDVIDNRMVLKSVLASLARFHSCSILTEASMSQEAKSSVALNEYYKDKFPETLFIRNGQGRSFWFSSVINFTCTLAEHFGYDPIKVRKLFERMFDMIEPSNIHRNVICHGDVHSKNVMFADCSPLLNCVLVDFQTYRYAPLVTDILQFLHINTTPKFRKENETNLVEFYHSILAETVKSNDRTNFAKIPTLNDTLRAMENFRVFGLVMACIYQPMSFIDAQFVKEHAGDPEFEKKIVCGDRTELTFAQMEADAIFKSKVEEVIRELIEKSA